MSAPEHAASSGFVRWLKFNVVGAIGIAVQLGMLALLTSALGINYLFATGLAVEATVLHNFLWHAAFTWADRRAPNRLARLVKFNLTTGVFSIGGNLFAMKVLVEIAGMSYLPANLLSVTACSLFNFLIADRAIFLLNSPERQSM
jgi:putative flippase GtrA